MRQLCCLFVLASCIASLEVNAQSKTDNELLRILHTDAPAVLSTVLKDPTKYRCQIIYTQINRNKLNVPSFKNYYFNYDPSVYYNPASMVKMPLAFLSLEKLNQLKVKVVNKYTPILFDSSFPGQVAMYKDSTAPNQLPSMAHFIKRAFLISENDPYNRMYQFVGQERINSALHQKGYPSIRITRQFMGYTEEQNKHTNPIRFLDANSQLLYKLPAAYNTIPFD
ncbi:MAG: serine hydrolase, partial [Sediminibacterium sp.]|nr:serine hydrolase [Sediminibacterium sp.]